MKYLELAIKIIAKEFKNDIETTYEDAGIENWSEMLRAFGWDSQDAKEEIADILEDYANKNKVDVRLTTDYEFIDNDEIISYRKFVNILKKELFK